MRGVSDRMTIGERIAFYRARRGLTQTALANLVGRGPDWLSKIERGERALRNIEVLAELARALRVTLGDLLGQPVLLENDNQLDDVPAVRDALMAPRRLSRVIYAHRSDGDVDLTRAARLVEYAWTDYQRGRLGTVITQLPPLVREAQQLEDAAPGLPHAERRQAWTVSAITHHLAATALSKVGEADLSWIAAERAMSAADQSDDVLVLASTARAATHALLAVGRFDDAVEMGDAAASWLAERLAEGDPVALSLLGMLHLRSAIAAARRQDRAATTELLDKADDAARRLGVGVVDVWHTGFGPANVEIHRLSAALDLGDAAWVADRGPRVNTAGLPAERRITHLTDFARALTLLARDDQALDVLLTAEREAPALVRHSAEVRETVKVMQRRAPVTGGRRSSDLLGLAARCRAVR